ncbi:MAG TPA: M14 family zinc carboxypeptidase [Steroidobacteraceae bacterium]|nr:M14 family zinc carboxypeptidase [Steroidobacteraceae bacterium]
MLNQLVTLAEQSDFRHTGRSDEVTRLCAAFAATWPHTVRQLEFGRSAQGRTLRALLVSRGDPHSLPLLMLQAGIHPGESDGKDAGFIGLRDILSGKAAADVLERIAILFVPAFNVDGHERCGRWNRPNQNGPEETGWRTTAHNLNLNRDYAKADSPEMRALLELIRRWDPLVCADLHVTDGADFQPDISLQAEPINQGDPLLHGAGRELRDALIARLAAHGSMPLPFYPDLAVTDDPASGFLLTVYSPRFSTGYFPQRNRFTVLVETHSWKDYATRVRVTRNTIVALAELLAEHGTAWRELARQADAAAVRIGGTEVVLDYSSGWREPAGTAHTEGVGATGTRWIDFPGYAYTRERSPISGEPVTVYDPRRPQTWRVPLRDEVSPALIVKAPRGGYVVPVEWAEEIGARLAAHGIRLEAVPAHCAAVSVETFRATQAQFSSTPFEGRMRLELTGSWQRESQDIAAGALFVPIAQPAARLLMHLLEPLAPDSFAAWGFFNACFEQKEYMEPYVADQVARTLLAQTPGLEAEFQHRLEQDAAFAASPRARLEFFLRRHASWDSQLNLYPVLRVDELPASASTARG